MQSQQKNSAEIKSIAKSLGITFTVAILIIIIISSFIPPEFLIFIKESKGYRMTELVLLAMIILLLGKKIIYRMKEFAPKRESFVDRKQSKDAFQREVLRTTQSELKKLQESKDYARWLETNKVRQNSSRLEDNLEEIVFSDEEEEEK